MAKDAYGFTLHYFDEGNNHDYAAIDNTQPFANTMSPGFTSLFNGNIAAMNINVPKIGQPVLHSYKYDQLNRIKEVNNYNSFDVSNNTWQATQQHKEALTFDPNGNIQTALLNGNNAQLPYENFNYNYDPVKKNQLISITNTVNSTTSNYEYDEAGNVIKDELEGNAQMDWNVYGKLSRVVKNDGTEILFKYDATGNRIAKMIGAKEEWYVRDASGNIMATYLKDPAVNSGKLSTESYYMYGSSMLGAWSHVTNMENTSSSGAIVTFERGEKNFYLGNQLNNNLVVLSDKKTGFDDNGDGIIDRYEADVLNATDYSAYGENLVGREFNSSTIKFGFNGKWNDIETGYQDYGMRMYSNKRRGFVSVDPLTCSFAMLTPYQFASNTPIQAVDLDGAESMFGWSIGLTPKQTEDAVNSWNKINTQIAKGTASGVKKSVGKTWNFVTSDVWKAKTWKNTWNSFGTFSDITVGNFEGRNDQLAYNVIQPHVDNFKAKVINGDAYSRAEYLAEFGTDLLTAEGIGKAFSVTKGMAVAERIAARSNFAPAFYERAGFSSAKALEHMEGIDFTKAVQTTTLKKGTLIQQWVGENGVGNYFTSLENGAAQNLGINYEGRTLRQFTLKEDVKILQSTAADYKQYSGGGTQYFSTELKDKITEVSTSPH